MDGVDAEVDASEIPEAVNCKPGPGQECESESKFADHEHFADPLAARTHSRPATLLEGFPGIDAGGIPCRGTAEEQTGERCSCKGKQQNGEIETEVGFRRKRIAWHGRDEPAQDRSTD